MLLSENWCQWYRGYLAIPGTMVKHRRMPESHVPGSTNDELAQHERCVKTTKPILTRTVLIFNASDCVIRHHQVCFAHLSRTIGFGSLTEIFQASIMTSDGIAQDSCINLGVTVLEGSNITKRFEGLVALSQFSFRVEQGQIVGLIGPNGSGKSTLFNVIGGFYTPEGGRIVYKGQDITGRKPNQIAKLGISRTFQIVRPFQELSVLDNVAAAVLYGRENASSTAVARHRAGEILQITGMYEKRDAMAHRLGLADRKRLELTRAVATGPEIILLDEVFAGLNETEVRDAVALLYRLRNEFGITIFMIEHVLTTVMDTCEKVLVLHYGKKIAEGRPQEVVHNPAVVEAYLGQDHNYA